VAHAEIRIPDIGDAENVEVIELVVEPGAVVEKDDSLIVLESDKASMDVPAPFAGKLVRFEVSVGDSVEKGKVFAVIERDAEGGEAAAREETGADDKAEKAEKAEDTEEKEETKQTKETEEIEEKKPPKAEEQEPAKEEKKPQPEALEKPGQEDEADKRKAQGEAGKAEADAAEGEAQRERAGGAAADESVYAGPAVRRFARELGVDLGDVKGSGHKGRIVKDDVAAHVKTSLSGAGAGAIPKVPLPDFGKFGATETVDRSRVLLRGAENLARSWLNVPHVTHHDDADVTELETFRASLKADAERRQTRLTPLPFIIKACIAALRAFPNFNASLSADGRQLILKRYYHIGIAVDTDNGLVVPVLRNADQKGLFELASELAEISDRAREGKLKSEDMQGASFTITSLGAIGGQGFTPIINAPEVAILGVSKMEMRPVWDGTAFAPRLMMPLSLSYDHRVVNGADAGRFMVYLCDAVRDLRRTLL
jgi:pyruvate dehydrogenase E2 component (dihydrolipoamide acetyltransferase)